MTLLLVVTVFGSQIQCFLSPLLECCYRSAGLILLQTFIKCLCCARPWGHAYKRNSPPFGLGIPTQVEEEEGDRQTDGTRFRMGPGPLLSNLHSCLVPMGRIS